MIAVLSGKTEMLTRTEEKFFFQGQRIENEIISPRDRNNLLS